MTPNKKLSPDLFTRHQLIAELVESVRKRKSINILDVGGYGGELFKFLPNDKVIVLDVVDIKEEDYVRGDARNINFSDGSFDVVTCSDTIEHIESKSRLRVYSELIRVAKDYVIIGAPFDSRLVRLAEKSIYIYFKDNTSRSHCWLEEHKKNGLPRESQLEAFLNQKGLDYFKAHSNNLKNWILLMMIQSYSEIYEDYDLTTINEIYNSFSSNMGDLETPAYRSTYLISKSNRLNKKLLSKTFESDFDPALYGKTIEAIVNTVSKKSRTIEELTAYYEKITKDYELIVNSRSWKLLTKIKKIKRSTPLIKNL